MTIAEAEPNPSDTPKAFVNAPGSRLPNWRFNQGGFIGMTKPPPIGTPGLAPASVASNT